ncbi:InlB B-repeat-containing protein [Parabacteroides timonensis]|uniref:InlB B-repeat-containing protein n=1 Tax=Parabacteroides timonensis TaxID=1871013 RepID=UPI00094E2580|nr:hypothetical protein [Parabacteroides timonensis]
MSKYYKNRIMGMGAWIVAFLFLCLPVAWGQAEVGILAVSGGIERTDYTYVDNTYTILTEKALTFSGTTTTDHIVVKEGVTANVTLNGVNIKLTDGGDDAVGTSAFFLKRNANLTLTLQGNNTFQSGHRTAGIQVEKGASITITGSGTLTSQGGWGGAGIGAGAGTSCGTILIKSGIVNAYAGDWAFGLGEGYFSNMTSTKEAIIQIEGGTVHAGGNNYGSSSMAGTIKISGGSVTTSYHSSSNYKGSAFGDITILRGTIDEWKISDNITVQDGTLTNCSFSGEVTVQGGTLTNISFSGKTTVQGGDFTNSSFSGESFVMYKGTINNTDGSRIDCTSAVIKGGEININTTSQEGRAAIHVTPNKTLYVNGGKINVVANKGAGIGGDGKTVGQGETCGTVIISGGNIIAKSGEANAMAIGGGGKWQYAGYPGEGGNITIEGGTLSLTGGIGSANPAKGTLTLTGGSLYDNKKGEFMPDVTNGTDPVYLGITPEIENVTDVSVDGKPYYVPGNHEGDNRLYLYMTADKHTITVRTNDNSITTYNATYNADGDTADGYFTITKGSSNTPTKQSALSFENEEYTAKYTPEEHQWKVKLNITAKQTKARLRSAAMNSVQLVLTDYEQDLTYYSDKQEVGASNEYTFTFSTKGLEVGNYKLTAQYGGDEETLISDMVTKLLKITQADGTTATDYTEPQDLSATYEDLLSDIPLGQGWAWDSPETSVGKVGVHGYQATFTPSDKNYGTVSTTLSVMVNRKEVTEAPEGPAALDAIIYDPSRRLTSITLDNNWEWAEEDIVPDVKTGEYTAYYDTDYDNYDWSSISGYNSEKHRVEKEITLQVNRADLTKDDFTFSVTGEDELTYDGLKKEATVTSTLNGIGKITVSYYDSEGTHSEVDPVNAGDYKVKISVTEGDNYNAIEGLTADGWVLTIKRANLPTEGLDDYFTFTPPADLYVDGSPKEATVSVSGLNGIGAITVNYYDAAGKKLSEAPVSAGTYTVKIDIAESINYNAVKELTLDKWTFTLKEKPFYTITLDAAVSGGTISADPLSAQEGTTVTLSYSAQRNYDFVGWTVTETNGGTPVTVNGSTFMMPASDVTVSARFTYNPPYVPEPDPVYYTVTLPAVEGATTDPSVGEYTVEAWNSFGFYLTLDADYDQSKPVVTTSRGETIEPRASDRKYVIPYVRSDLDIRISGIVKNPDPVANEAIRADTVEVRGGEGCLYLRLGMRREVGIYTFTGSLLRFAEVAPGDSRWTLPTGNYIVRIDGKSYKVAVR